MNDWGTYAIRIEKTRKPSDWPKAIAEVPEEHRGAVEAYLRSMARRIRNVRRLRGRPAAA